MKNSLKTAFFLIILTFSLLGCTRTTATSTPLASVTPAFTETPTATPAPTRVILVSGSGVDPALVDQMSAELEALSSQAGLTLEQRGDLQPSEISSDMKVVVFASTPGNINDFLGSAGNTQFVVVSDQDIPSATNLTVIRVHPEFSLFMAGYIAEMITADWRVAGLIPSDIPQTDVLQQVFQNGGRYWCGICKVEAGPYVSFPLVVSLPLSSDASAWNAALDQLQTNRVYTMVAWDLANVPDVLQYISLQSVFSEQGIFVHPILLGNEIPTDSLRPSWAVTLVPDISVPLQAAWADLMIGSGGRSYAAGVKMTEINELLFGLGKQRLADETIQKLVLGLIDPANP